MNASTLAASLRSFETPEAVYRQRLALAAGVADVPEPLVAALVVGSTALRRSSARADLDVVLVTEAPTGPDRFSSQVIEDVRVEVERLGRRRALACTEGDGWVWELREAARLGCAAPVLDPTGFAAELAERSAAMAPRRARVEATLRHVYLSLVALGRGEGDGSHRADALRGCLDNLALLALLEHPRRYQKPKWVLADLLHAGEDLLVDALLAAYGIDGDATAARAAVAGAGEVIARAYEIAGVPAHGELLAMGHAPHVAEASYVSRCLDDAEDLESSGRFAEARYVALFAARLAAGLLRGAGGVIDTFAERGGAELARCYLALFDAGPGPDTAVVEAALAAADARRERLERPA